MNSENLNSTTLQGNQNNQGQQEPVKRVKKFMTRADFIANIDMPKSDQSRIVIPSNSRGDSFRRDCYMEQYLKGTLSKEEFDQVVEQASKITQHCYTEKRSTDDKQVAKVVVWTLSISFLLMALFPILFYRGTIHKSPQMVWISIALLAVSTMMFLTIMIIFGFSPIKDIPSFEEQVKRKIDEYFGKINGEFVTRGLWWRVVPGHYWIELRIDLSLKIDIDKINVLQREGSNFFARTDEDPQTVFTTNMTIPRLRKNQSTYENADQQSTRRRKGVIYFKNFNQDEINQELKSIQTNVNQGKSLNRTDFITEKTMPRLNKGPSGPPQDTDINDILDTETAFMKNTSPMIFFDKLDGNNNRDLQIRRPDQDVHDNGMNQLNEQDSDDDIDQIISEYMSQRANDEIFLSQRFNDINGETQHNLIQTIRQQQQQLDKLEQAVRKQNQQSVRNTSRDENQ